MNERNATTSERLRLIMEQENIRQIDILERCLPYLEQYKIKMNRSDVSQYISGKATPKQNKLYILARALNVSEAWLLGYDVPKERTGDNSAAIIELESVAQGLNSKQLSRLLEYARLLKNLKDGD